MYGLRIVHQLQFLQGTARGQYYLKTIYDSKQISIHYDTRVKNEIA